jgi:hypothetical protein
MGGGIECIRHPQVNATGQIARFVFAAPRAKTILEAMVSQVVAFGSYETPIAPLWIVFSTVL